MANSRYTQKDKEFIVDNFDKLTYIQFAEHFNITRSNFRALVANLRKQDYNLPSKKENKKSSKDGYKFCSKCGEEKIVDDFPNDKSYKDGKKGMCRDCYGLAQADYRAKNPIKIKEWSSRSGDYKPRRKLGDGRVNNIGVRGLPKRKFKEHFRLNDESVMPEGHYKDCLMKNVPSWHLLGMLHNIKCDPYVKDYIERNLETLQMENKK